MPTQATHGGQPLAQSLLKVFSTSTVQTKFLNPLDGNLKGADIKQKHNGKNVEVSNISKLL